MKKTLIAVALLCCMAAGPILAQQPQVPQAKQTVPGLYVTASEAYEKWQADPEQVDIIDVHTAEEYIFVGHPTMARNIPLQFLSHDAGKMPVMKPNPDFVAQVKRVVKPTDTILVVCRSGQRSAAAVNLLAEAKFEKVYNVFDGVEGDKVKDPESVFHGKRMKNGWKNSGLPWTYDLDPRLMYLVSAGQGADQK